MYGRVSENTCAPTANTRSRTSSGKRVATETPGRETVKPSRSYFRESAITSRRKSRRSILMADAAERCKLADLLAALEDLNRGPAVQAEHPRDAPSNADE